MKRTVCSTMIVAAFAAAPFVVGCEDTVSKHSETKTTSDGTTVKKEEKVTRNPDGSLNKTQSVDVDKPNHDSDVKVKVDTK